MNVRIYIVLSFAFYQIAGCAPTKAKESERPNIIILLVDDLGYADLPEYGHGFHETPNIDRLASQSVKFTNAYAPAPICSPSRAAILTGRHTTILGITDFIAQGVRAVDSSRVLLPAKNRSFLATSFPTIASVLSDEGYETASIGKWHLGGEGSLPEDHGFNINIAGNHRGMPPTYYHPYYPDGGDPVIPHLIENDRPGEYLSDRITREAVNFIETNRTKPFFLYLPYFTVHIPIEGRQDLVSKFSVKASDQGLDHANVHYAAMVAALDESVGRILESLDKEGLRENTLIILTSDNGGLHTREGPRTPATDNGNLREGKGWLYEGGIKVPLYLHRPSQSHQEENGAPVSLMGIFPTVLDGLGIDLDIELDGRSFYHEADGNHPLFWHYPHYSNQGGAPSSAIREGRFKLIYWYETETVELFDLQNDPAESKNIVEIHPEVVQDLQKKLQSWLKETKALYPTKLEK